MFYWITIPSQELTLKLEKLTEERGKKNKMLDNEVTNTLTTQVLFLVDLDIHMFIDSLIFWWILNILYCDVHNENNKFFIYAIRIYAIHRFK